MNLKNNLNKILKTLLFLLVIIFVFASFSILLKNKENLTNIFNFRFFIVKSGSMYPKLDINDIVIVKKCENYDIEDIITYNCQNKYFITHRIIEKNENAFITKGDNNNSEDLEKVKIQNVKGKVILIIKNKYLKIMITIILVIILIEIFKKGKCNEKHN